MSEERRPSGPGRPPEPPSGSPWDDALEEAPLVFVDLEMDGLRPAVDRVIEVCAERVREGAVLVAHSASWDVAFLEAELARAGRPRRIEHYLDTLTLSRRAFALPSHRLAALCETFGITRERAHRAEDDVHALRGVWAKIVEALGPKT